MIDPKLKNSPALLDEIKKALGSVSWGSVEIIVQDKKVTQLTVRQIVKTSLDISEENNEKSSDNMQVKTIRINKPKLGY